MEFKYALLLLFSMFPLYFFLCFIHELGHLAAGFIYKSEFVFFAIMGRFYFIEDNKLRSAKSQKPVLGAVLFYPPAHNSRKALLALTIGGPLMDLFLLLCSLWFFYLIKNDNQPVFHQPLAVFALLLIAETSILFFSNIIPMKFANFSSDGFKFLAFFNPENVEIYLDEVKKLKDSWKKDFLES